MQQLNQYQIKLLQQNVDSTKQLILQNELQLQKLSNPTAIGFLQQQIKCLKQNVSMLQESIRQKKIIE